MVPRAVKIGWSRTPSCVLPAFLTVCTPMGSRHNLWPRKLFPSLRCSHVGGKASAHSLTAQRGQGKHLPGQSLARRGRMPPRWDPRAIRAYSYGDPYMRIRDVASPSSPFYCPSGCRVNQRTPEGGGPVLPVPLGPSGRGSVGAPSPGGQPASRPGSFSASLAASSS